MLTRFSLICLVATIFSQCVEKELEVIELPSDPPEITIKLPLNHAYDSGDLILIRDNLPIEKIPLLIKGNLASVSLSDTFAESDSLVIRIFEFSHSSFSDERMRFKHFLFETYLSNIEFNRSYLITGPQDVHIWANYDFVTYPEHSLSMKVPFNSCGNNMYDFEIFSVLPVSSILFDWCSLRNGSILRCSGGDLSYLDNSSNPQQYTFDELDYNWVCNAGYNELSIQLMVTVGGEEFFLGTAQYL